MSAVSLRELFDTADRPLRIIEAHNGLSALIAAETVASLPNGATRSFDGIWLSSLTETASRGLPDVELCGLGPRVALGREVALVTHKPIVMDADTGGNSRQVAYYTRAVENTGVTALVMEDKVFPKCNSLCDHGEQIVEVPEVFASKLGAALAARRSPDFMVIARIEALVAGLSIDDALQRAKCYVQAGADALVIHSKKRTPDEVLAFAEGLRRLNLPQPAAKRLIAIPTTYNSITEDELYAAGFKLVIHANHLLRSAYVAMEKTAQAILMNGRSLEIEPDCVALPRLLDAVDRFAEI